MLSIKDRTSKKNVDLHVHSNYSDGTYTPYEIIKESINNNIQIVSITDHNCIDGSLEAINLCKNEDLIIIPGVELDSAFNNKVCHILAYDFDIENIQFQKFVNENKMLLENLDKNTLASINNDCDISIDAYESYEHDYRMGGFKLISFLMVSNIAKTQEEAFKLMKKYKGKAGFLNPKDVITKIHEAGGVAILAHPGVTFKNTKIEKSIKTIIEEFVEMGIDGIECYYPAHNYTYEQELIDMCEQHNLMITVGSDFHGNFFKNSKQKIGCEFKKACDLKVERRVKENR